MFTEEKLEALASIEHEQWKSAIRSVTQDLEFIKALLTNPSDVDVDNAISIINKRLERWTKYQALYPQLDATIQDMDKVWAKKVMEEFRPKNTKEAVESIISILKLMDWRYAIIEPEDKSTPLEGFIIGTERFCSDTVTIVTNFLSMLEEKECKHSS